MHKLIADIEMIIELQELIKLKLSDEEIDGYFEFFIESWISSGDVIYDN